MSEETIERLHGCVKVEIVKPVDGDWETIGARLRDVREVVHRCLNHAITACALADHVGDRDHAGAARKAVKELLDRERASAQEQLAKPATAKKPPAYVARLERAAALALPSVIEDCIARKAQQAFAKWRSAYWKRADECLPSFRHGAPIFVRDGDAAWSVERDGNQYRLYVKLYPGRTGKIAFVVAADGGGAHAHMRRVTDQDAIARGDVKVGDLKLIWSERKKKWIAVLAYSWPKPADVEKEKTIAVRRGVSTFIAGACSDGDSRVLANGGDIVAFKSQMQARRQSLQRHLREVGAGCRGHGERRYRAAVDKLADKESRWVRTKCQQLAAAVVKYANGRGAGEVIIEDFGGPMSSGDGTGSETKEENFIRKWPFAELKACILWACAKNGLRVREVSATRNTRTCPSCKHEHDQPQIKVFECASCGLRRPLDEVAVWNLLIKANDVSHGVFIEKEKRAKKQAARFRAKVGA